jgi:NAD(P) transhydrogenase subunit alpha
MDMHLLASTEWPLLAADEGLTALSVPFLRFYVFVLAGFVGFQIITKVPALLHTPLMSATNAISGISLVGSLVAAGAQFSKFSTFLGFLAVTAATINVVGGFMITDRMLKMFRRQERK